ncbi:MAG: DUF3553 domain-containing protein, partial [bacterium]
DMAVFYRINAQSRAFEEALRKKDIPYVVVGGMSFYERKEIKDIISYLSLLNNPNNAASFARIANEPRRKLGAQSVEHILQAAEFFKCSILRACQRADEITTLSAQAKKSAKRFAQMFSGWRQDIQVLSPEPLVKKMLFESGYEEMLTSSADPQDQSRWENVGELVSALAAFEKECRILSQASLDTTDILELFLENVSLVSDVDEWKDREDCVVLMTLHSAKGLEFKVVFLTGMEEGLLPHHSAFDNTDELEEERRLCYVGITRARERLFMTHAYTRRLFGSPQQNLTSRFLREIPDSCKKILPSITMPQESVLEFMKSKRYITTAAELAEALPPPSEFNPGDTVNHRTFGLGVVLEITGQGSTARITVDFQNVGKKTVVQAYAKLRKV